MMVLNIEMEKKKRRREEVCMCSSMGVRMDV
jgi:hypothetical protein